ncbi:MAG TPA: hypothetical protein VFQ92_25385 [Blastocatellia bacterium]|nr:hypothetical protein [Blastocatellia bacterium]
MYFRGLSHRRAIFRSLLTLVLFVFSISTIAVPAGAQSGRKPPKKSEPSAPVQGAEPEPPPGEPTEKPEAVKLGIHIVRDSPSMRSSEFLSNLVIEAVSERLKQASSLTVGRGKGMNRKEASDHAKRSKTDHVLWVELDYDSMSMTRSPTYRRSGREIYIDYAVFARETGKVMTHGRIYERPLQARVGGVGLPVPTGREPVEYIIRQAGHDVADRVMGALNISAPPRR